MGPKQLPHGYQCYADARALLQRPRCAALIGAIVAAWSFAESSLAHYYSQLLFGPAIERSPIHPGAWAAMEAFDTLANLGQRRTMLLVTARRRGLFTDDEIKQFEAGLRKLQNVQDDRIIAAHGRWSICNDLPDAIVWMKGVGNVGDAWVYDETVLSAQLDRIEQRSHELHVLFFQTFSPKLKVAAETFAGHIFAAHEHKNAT